MRKLIIVATTLVPSVALAGGYAIPNEDARDLALGQAAVADQTDAGAVILNPAALAGPEGLGLSGSLELLRNDTDWSDPSLGNSSLVAKTNTPPAGAISFGQHLGNGMAYGVGVGMSVAGGGSLIWPNGWQGQDYIQSVEQKVYLIGAGAAFQPLPYVKVGATFLRYQAEEELHQELNYLDHEGDAGLALSGGASTFGVGIEVRVPQIPLTLAASYKHSANLGLAGHAHFEGVPAQLSPMIHDQSVTEALKIPNVLDLGAAYAIDRHLKVMFDYTFERWTVYPEDRFVGSDGFTVVVPRDYHNAHIFRFGVEWAHPRFLPALTLRAGIIRSLSNQPTETVSPSLTDGNSTAPSIGLGFDFLRSLRLDVGYQHAFFDDVTASGTEALPGTYKTHVDIFSIGLNWRTDLLGCHHHDPQ